MAKFHIKLGSTAKEAEVTVNGRPMLNVIALSIKQGADGQAQVAITIPVTELVVEGEAVVSVTEVKNA